MQTIRIAGFAGASPNAQPRLLPPEVGTVSTNQKPGRGDLRPFRVPLTVATVPSGRRTIYRFNRAAASDSSYWFSWTSTVHVTPAYRAEDSTERTYYTEGGVLKVTDNLIGLAGAPYPTTGRQVGVPGPIAPPTLTQTAAGTGDDETRFYVYTYLNDWNEESVPSPAARITCKPGALIDITGMSVVPSGSHGINRIRVYRTVAGTTGADFFFLREITAATSTEDDARSVGSDTLQSAGPVGVLGRQWSVPPTGLKGLVRMWNGMFAAIVGKSVRICEPFKPYAWPPAYEILSVDTPVALAVVGKVLIIATTGTPLAVEGSTPEALDGPPVRMVLPCVSDVGMVQFKDGAAWPSSEGLAYMGADGVPSVVTRGHFTKEQWQALNPTTMVGTQYEGHYIGFYEQSAGVWKGFHLDPKNPTGIYSLDTGYPAAYFDELQGTLYVLAGADVQKWDAGSTYMAATFRSKVFRLEEPDNPAIAEVIADGYPGTFKLWAGRYDKTGWPAGSLKITKTVTSRAPFNLPSGYLADDVQVEVTFSDPVTGLVVAGDVSALQEP